MIIDLVLHCREETETAKLSIARLEVLPYLIVCFVVLRPWKVKRRGSQEKLICWCFDFRHKQFFFLSKELEFLMHYCYAGAGNVHTSKMHSGPSAFQRGREA